jgi:hypothetical protein
MKYVLYSIRRQLIPWLWSVNRIFLSLHTFDASYQSSSLTSYSSVVLSCLHSIYALLVIVSGRPRSRSTRYYRIVSITSLLPLFYFCIRPQLLKPVSPVLSRTWISHGNLRNLLLAHVSPYRRDRDDQHGTHAADDNAVEVCGLVDRGPFEVVQWALEEERGDGSGHVDVVGLMGILESGGRCVRFSFEDG